MTPIELLNDEELGILTEIITIREIKEWFRSNPKGFNKIAPGRVAKKMTDAEIIRLIINSRKVPFVMGFVNTRVNAWLREISEYKDSIADEYPNEENALVATLKESVFSEHIGLYFKLAKAECADEYIAMIDSKVKEIPDESACLEPNGESELLKAEIEELKVKLRSAEQSAASYSQTVDELESKIDEISKENIKLQKELSEKENELAEFRKRAAYDDSELSFHPIVEYDYSSLFSVNSVDGTGNIKLARIADISAKGVIEMFAPFPGLPKTFDNSDFIITKDGPLEVGAYGVWDWSAVENKTNPEKAFFKSAYNESASPVQVIILTEAKSIEQIISLLDLGIKVSTSFSRILFAFYKAKGQLAGVLCNASDLEYTGSAVCLNKKVFALPKYDFESKDLLWLENRMAVFRRLTLGMPSAEIQVIEPISIVKDIVLKRVSWPIFKAKGVTKSDWQNFKKYLEMIPEEGIVEEISAACRSSEAQAVQLLDEFCTSANSYFDGDTIEETMIAKAIMDSPELLQRSKEMVSAEWHKENDTAIKEANAALAAVQAETAATERRNVESISELEKINAKIAEVSSTLDEKLGFAENVDTIVAERIQKAKENAAEFIASMAFAAPPSPVASEVTPVQISTVSTIMPAAEYCTGAMLDLTNMEEYKDARTAIESIGFELAEAGVADKFTHALAAYLFANYVDHSCILLAGPNAQDIADAFSAALFGKTAGKLCCAGEYSSVAIDSCLNSDDEVVVITEPFAPGWITKLPEIIRTESKFFFAIYPYAEDVLIEPKSIYSSFLPIFTEFLVDNVPSGTFGGGKPAKAFKDYQPRKADKLYPKALNILRTGMLIKNRMQRVLTNMEYLLDDKSADNAFLLSILPYAYATMQIGTLAEFVKNEGELHLSSEMSRYVGNLFGEFE